MGTAFPLVLLGLAARRCVADSTYSESLLPATDSTPPFFARSNHMPRKTDDERLAALIARRNRTDEAIRRLRIKNEKIARAEDARRKIVAGALALEHTIKNPGSEFARIMLRLLDQYARPHERFLFADLLPGGDFPTGEGEKLAGDDPLQNGAESISDAAE
jgi:hypothetical protein